MSGSKALTSSPVSVCSSLIAVVDFDEGVRSNRLCQHHRQRKEPSQEVGAQSGIMCHEDACRHCDLSEWPSTTRPRQRGLPNRRPWYYRAACLCNNWFPEDGWYASFETLRGVSFSQVLHNENAGRFAQPPAETSSIISYTQALVQADQVLPHSHIRPPHSPISTKLNAGIFDGLVVSLKRVEEPCARNGPQSTPFDDAGRSLFSLGQERRAGVQIGLMMGTWNQPTASMLRKDSLVSMSVVSTFLYGGKKIGV